MQRRSGRASKRWWRGCSSTETSILEQRTRSEIFIRLVFLPTIQGPKNGRGLFSPDYVSLVCTTYEISIGRKEVHIKILTCLSQIPQFMLISYTSLQALDVITSVLSIFTLKRNDIYYLGVWTHDSGSRPRAQSVKLIQILCCSSLLDSRAFCSLQPHSRACLQCEIRFYRKPDTILNLDLAA